MKLNGIKSSKHTDTHEVELKENVDVFILTVFTVFFFLKKTNSIEKKEII